ncbi:KxYKxGKxW signal peptide domain-containing protein [Weissella minor]|uniref:Gram-positive cocci surface proteins LPxTG domain-containing protein n=1 Tax=Weissella minor TaxID=1620 RepID=A0A0R2JJJ5_9LACO|nr:KxYKxGKxW signal peptide domain-containing protein [Weissella minor]KRN77438.1 hypothetical protein IV67_GL001489 [Weissella minor]
MNEQTEHVKLYKSGKFWVSAVVGTLFSTAALGLNTVDAHADDGTATKANATPTIEQQGSTQTNQAEVTLDAAKTTADQNATPATSQAASNSTTEQSTSAAASTQAVSSQAVSTSASQSALATESVDTQSAAPASATAAATQKYPNGTYKTDTSKSYKKAGATTETSTMQQYMGNTGSIKINNDQTIITLPAKNAMTAGWLQKITLNGYTGVKNGTDFSFTIPTSELNAQMNGFVKVYADLGFMVIDEEQPFALQLDLSQVTAAAESNAASQSAAQSQSIAQSNAASKSAAQSQSVAQSNAASKSAAQSQSVAQSNAASKSAAQSQSVAQSNAASKSAAQSQSVAQSNANSQSEAQSQSTAESKSATDSKSNRQLADGNFSTTGSYKKSGSQESSSMGRHLSSDVKVSINGNQTELTITATSEESANMIPKLTLNGIVGQKDGLIWTFSLPTSALSEILSGTVTVQAGPYNNTQPFDLLIDTTDIPTATTPDSQAPSESETGSQSQEQSQSQDNSEAQSEAQSQDNSEAQSEAQSQDNSEAKSQAQSQDSSEAKSQHVETPETKSHADKQLSSDSATETVVEVLGGSTAPATSEFTVATPEAKAVIKQSAKNSGKQELPNTAGSQEAVLTGLGVLIGTIGLGGALKKRH